MILKRSIKNPEHFPNDIVLAKYEFDDKIYCCMLNSELNLIWSSLWNLSQASKTPFKTNLKLINKVIRIDDRLIIHYMCELIDKHNSILCTEIEIANDLAIGGRNSYTTLPNMNEYISKHKEINCDAILEVATHQSVRNKPGVFK